MRITLPAGQWIDLKDLGELNRDHQDDWADLREKIRDAKEAARAPLPPVSPLNPAVMADPSDRPERPPVTLNTKDVRPMHDQVLTWMVTDSSYGWPLPWTPAMSVDIGLPAWNKVIAGLEPVFEALNGIVPKENPTGTGT
jgi:hypothetical protein